MEVRAAASGAAGTSLEFFDFSIYGALAATLFPQLFFSDLGPAQGLLTSFATFGVGFVARPLGAIVFSHFGDKYGRQPVLFFTLLLMGAASISIGLLPTGQGFAIAAVLVGLRFLQGFSLGGETTGNQLMVVEHADKTRRGLLGSFIGVAGPLGQVLANLSLFILSATLTDHQFETWGWRVPFIGSILIIAAAVFIRLRLEETPAFVASKKRAEVHTSESKPATGTEVLKSHTRTVALLTLVWGGPASTFFLIVVYGLSYLTKEAGFTNQTTFAILLIGNAVSCVTCFAGGMLSDKIGRKPIMIIGVAGAFVGVGMFFTLASSSVLMAGLIVTAVLGSVMFANGAQPAFYAEQFPTEVRFAGCALSYNFANLIFSAPAPFLAAALATSGGSHLLMLISMLVLLSSGIAITQLKDGRHIDLETFTQSHPQKSPITAPEL